MGRWIMTLLVIFIGSSIISAAMAGGGGILSTPMTVSATASDTTISANISTAWASSGKAVIEGEIFSYTGINATRTQFTGCTRGEEETIAYAHIMGTMIYTEEISLINEAMGFNVSEYAAQSGAASVVTIPLKTLTTTLPKLFYTNFNFLTGDLAIIGLIFYVSVITLFILVAIAIWRG